MKSFTSKTQKVGEFGESLATRWLTDEGYTIVERNWACSLGEIDIIATKDDILHFIEVKSVQANLSGSGENSYNPADNVTNGKLQKVIITCLEYIHKVGISGYKEWVLDVVLVKFDTKTKKAHINMIQSVTRD